MIEHNINIRKLSNAYDSVKEALEIFECKYPAGGLGPGSHCAACCYGTGYVVTCEEDDELVTTLSAAYTALSKVMNSD